MSSLEHGPGVDAAATQAERTSLLLEAGLLLASDLSLRNVLERLVELAARITSAQYAACGVLAPDGTIADFVTFGLSPAQIAAIGKLPKGKGILGVLIEDPRPLRLDCLGDHPQSVGFPPNHPAMRTFLGVPVRAEGVVFGNLYLTEKIGADRFTDDDEAAVITLAAQAGRMIANARAYQDLSRRERWLRAIHRTASAMLAGAAEGDLLHSVLHEARQLGEADFACVVLPVAGDPGHLRVAAVDGAMSHRLEHRLLPRGGAASHAVMRTGRPRLVASGNRQLSWFWEAGVPAEGLMVLPLIAEGRAAGTFLLGRIPGHPPFLADDLSLADSFSAQAALALDYVNLQKRLQRLAVLEERQRIARDIHDEPVQALIYLARRLERLAGEPEVAGSAADQVGDIRNLAIGVADGLRQLTEGLRSEVLEELGLGPALKELGERFGERAEVEVSVRLRGGGSRWPTEIEKGWLRIAQEALSNVERHSEAASVHMCLDQSPTRLRLCVYDDGVGFPTSRGRPGREGLGMMGMRERAALLGGSLRVRSRPGRYTLVLASASRAIA